ncbi:MAG TPA: hypothetical protein IAB47_08365 [Candidatus Scatomorpha merdigallinarum]|nr:hypothetical protein [Candidatus Scatomorpha merdigallinarum]
MDATKRRQRRYIIISCAGLVLSFVLFNLIEHFLYAGVISSAWRRVFAFFIILSPVTLAVKWKSPGRKKAAVAIWGAALAVFVCAYVYNLPNYTFNGSARIIVSEHPELEGVDCAGPSRTYDGRYICVFATDPATGYEFDPHGGRYEYVGDKYADLLD